MNILCFSEHYLPIVSGSATYTDNLCDNLALLGHRVHLVMFSDEKLYPPHQWLIKNNYRVYNFGLPKGLRQRSRRARAEFLSRLIKGLPGIMLEIKPDIVHVLYGHYLPKILYKKHASTPVIWTVQNTPPREYLRPNLTGFSWVDQWLNKLYFIFITNLHKPDYNPKYYAAIVAPSAHTKENLLENKVSAESVFVIPDGVKSDYFRPYIAQPHHTQPNKESNFPLILCVAGVAEHKGQLFLLRALQKIISSFPAVRLICIGPVRDSKYAKRLQNYLRHNFLLNNCEFISNSITAEELLNFYRQCDVYVQPSLEEGFCLAILEAAACGKQVIGTNMGAIPEIVASSVRGKICPVGDSDCLSKNIIDVLNKPLNTAEAALQHHKLSDKYSWETVAQKTLALYSQILAR